MQALILVMQNREAYQTPLYNVPVLLIHHLTFLNCCEYFKNLIVPLTHYQVFYFYSNSTVPVGFGVKSYNTRLMPATS